MNPTPKIRWVERISTFVTQPYGVVTSRKTRILQQWWDFDTFAGDGEWRDVPLETEE